MYTKDISQIKKMKEMSGKTSNFFKNVRMIYFGKTHYTSVIERESKCMEHTVPEQKVLPIYFLQLIYNFYLLAQKTDCRLKCTYRMNY